MANLPARPAHQSGAAQRPSLKRALDPPREPASALSGVLDEARLQPHNTALRAPYVVHARECIDIT